MVPGSLARLTVGRESLSCSPCHRRLGVRAGSSGARAVRFGGPFGFGRVRVRGSFTHQGAIGFDVGTEG